MDLARPVRGDSATAFMCTRLGHRVAHRLLGVRPGESGAALIQFGSIKARGSLDSV